MSSTSDDMACRELVELVTDYLEDRLPLAERQRFAAHLAACSNCQAYLEQMRAALEQLCAQQVPGDTHRNLRIYPTFSGKTFKHLLVPIWLLVYTFGRNPFQVVVNGYTGRIAGRYPYSPWKVAFLIVVVVLAIILFALANEG